MGRDVEGAGAPVRSIKPPDVRKVEIVTATRALFREQGISRTTLKDVAERVGITRGLIYHYFGSMDGLVDVVLEAYVAEFVEAVREWDSQREVGNIDRALVDCIGMFRRELQTDDPLRADLHRAENAGLYLRFVDRAVEAVVDCIRATTVEAYARRHEIAIENVRETFTVLVYGLIGLTRSQPETEDSVLVGIVRQTLYL